MLERTAGCIEPGSLRRLVPGSKKPFKTQRMLHSTFWTHGAGELDLPPLWNMLLGEYSASRDDDRKGTKGCDTTRPNPGFLLDLLYPAGTFTFLRQFSGWPIGWQGAKHRNPSSARFGHRLFSSGTTVTPRSADNSSLPSAENVAPEIEHSAEFGEDQTQVEITDQLHGVSRATQLLKDLMKSPEPRIDYEEVWRLYNLLPPEQERLVVSEVLEYLSHSERRVDAERIVSLLDDIPAGERNSVIWRAGAQSLIDIDKLPEAVALHRMALEYNEPSVSPLIIAAQLKANDWESTYNTWAVHHSKTETDTEEDPRAPLDNPVMMEASTYLPHFASIVLRFASEMDRYFTEAEIESSQFQAFAILLTRHALIPPSGTFSARNFMFLLEFLQRWKADSPAIYRSLITRFLNKGNIGLAVTSYNHFHQYFRSHLSRHLLRTMVKVFCDLHDVEGIQQVLDDWFFCFDGPDRFSYRQCLREFAWQADAPTVEALFAQYIEKFCRDGTAFQFERPDEFAPLLNVYAKRGELEKVTSIFERMSSEYGVVPSLACWNILINAYGKVQDIDGAFERFQQLLESRLKPDHYTMGTLMGMCVIRGDRERTIELFQLAISMEITASPAMIGCLVLVYIQDGQLKEASDICETAIGMELVHPPNEKSPLTRMWNQLLLGYTFSRDLPGTNEVIQRMGELEVEFDMYTYSALMQSLAIHGMTNKAWKMLTQVMPKAGVEVNSFHYAIVMGGFLRTGELDMVFRAYDAMLSHKIKPDTNTSFQALKASVELDKQRILTSTEYESRFELAEEYFDRVVRTIDPLQVNPSIPRKGMGRDPVDLAYNTAVFRHMIFVYGSNRMMNRVKELYAEYLRAIPEKKKNRTPPIRMLEALIHANMVDENFQGVKQCWQMAFENAKKEASSLKADEDTGKNHILHYHRFSLALCLMTYMTALSRENKYDELQQVVIELLETGFDLDARNWNLYIQCMVRGGRIGDAFRLCEAKLMDQWMGWKDLRRQDNIKNNLPFYIRAQKRQASYLRPYHEVFLFLARAWLDLKEVAAENPEDRSLVENMVLDCPKLIAAIQTMQRTADEDELRIMTSDEL